MTSTRSPRFNLKISPLLRPRFEEPYDAYLNHLLDLTMDITTFDPLQIDGKTSKTTAGQNRWTVWVSREIRDKFNIRKAVLAPNRTHGQFVELLLLYKDSLIEKGFNVEFNSSSKDYKDKLEIRTNYPAIDMNRRSSPDTYAASPRGWEPTLSPLAMGLMNRTGPVMIQNPFMHSPDITGSFETLDSFFDDSATSFPNSYSSFSGPTNDHYHMTARQISPNEIPIPGSINIDYASSLPTPYGIPSSFPYQSASPLTPASNSFRNNSNMEYNFFAKPTHRHDSIDSSFTESFARQSFLETPQLDMQAMHQLKSHQDGYMMDNHARNAYGKFMKQDINMANNFQYSSSVPF